MKKTIIWLASVIGVGAVLALALGALERNTTGPRTIAVNGECLTTVPKDRTAITLRVTTLDASASTSMKMATAQVAEITDFLKTQPVKMQTTEFNSYEKTEWNRELQKSISLGIETTIAIEVSATSIDAIESVLNQFAGTPNVFSENLRMFTSPEAMKPVLEKCLGVAVENARVRANALASGDDRRAGKLLSVSYGTQTTDVARPTAGALRSAKMMVAESAVDTGGSLVSKDTDVSVSVSAVFEIK